MFKGQSNIQQSGEEDKWETSIKREAVIAMEEGEDNEGVYTGAES